ncbi:MAG: hypothetical protein R2853_20250 [Thermomicrobiales bacterium]|nr:hypothetical protein [Thermomicrobiales bacterium]
MAPALTQAGTAATPHQFASGSAEVERLRRTRDEVRDVLLGELQERERAAAEFERLGLPDRATALRDEAGVVARDVAVAPGNPG